MTNDDWKAMLAKLPSDNSIIVVRSQHAQLAYPVSAWKQYCPEDVNTLMTLYQHVQDAEREIMEYIKEGIIDIVQLHGDETPELIRKLKESKVKVIRSLAADKTSEEYAENIQLADAVLLDTASREYGGTGKSFDWGILEDKLARLGNKKYFLAGGLNSRNIVRAIRRFQPAGVDMSSCLETQGCKDEIKIKKIRIKRD